MLTFEKVLEIFADYLTVDETIEVYISRHGCVRVEFEVPADSETSEISKDSKNSAEASPAFRRASA